MRPRPDLSVYLVLDRALCGGSAGMVQTARAAAMAGVGIIQLRDKEASTADRVALGRKLAAALEGTAAALVINDDVHATQQLAAEGLVQGLHVGQGDTAAEAARAAIGPDLLLGLSVETVAQAKLVNPEVVDHIGAGPVFATPTKTDAAQPVGWDGLARIAAASPVPAVAIGGVKPQHGGQVRAAGCVGMAVVSAICGQSDPGAAAHAALGAMAQGAKV